MPTDHQRERGARFKAGLPAVLHHEDGDVDCVAIDLSRAGVLIAGAFAWPASPEIGVTIRSAAGDRSFTARGTIAHVMEDTEAGTIKVGLLFQQDLDDDDAVALEALVSRVVEGTSLAGIERLSDDASPEEIRAALEQIPVPHRIALARRATTARERALIRHDPSPQVLEGLARNPHLNSPEAASLIRQATLLPTTIELMAKDPRWRGNQEMQIALATHPRVTLPVAERIVRGMSIGALRTLIRRPGLHPAIRDKILATVPRGTLQGW